MNETRKAALLLSGLQTKTVDTLLSRLDSETARTLLRELRTMSDASEHEKNKVAEEFLHTLSVRKQRFASGIVPPAATVSAAASSGTYRRPFSAAGLRPQIRRPEKFDFLNRFPPEITVRELVNERPQIIAAVLSYLAAPVKQKILPQLPTAIRNEVAEILTQNNGIIPISSELLNDIESALRERFQQRSEEFSGISQLSNADLSTLFHRVDLMTAMLSLVGAEPSFIQRVVERFSPADEAEMRNLLRQLDKIDENDVLAARITLLEELRYAE
ncbi:hypothetical protein FACS18942_03410 [Planctomycetales bacterium]|nr:hypothetical protein FACS18942_03410 [Planctomycetales bacterium]